MQIYEKMCALQKPEILYFSIASAMQMKHSKRVLKLYLIYGVARKVGASWVEHDQILFLLDGLDEVEESARSACVAAMNHYREEHFVPLIVSSRFSRTSTPGAIFTKQQVSLYA